MQNKKFIIFDLDGTLIDSSVVIANSINYVREQLLLPPMEHQQIIACINNVNIHAPSFFYEAQEFNKEHEVWFQEYYTQNHKDDSRLYEGIEGLLKKLSKTRKLSVATNAYKITAHQMLEAKDIHKYFDRVLCADEVKNAKPHPEMLDAIVNHYGANRDQFVMIGDGHRDILAANNAGMDSILIDWGFNKHHQNVVKSVEELEKNLLSI